MTGAEVARRLGVSKQMINELEHSALKKVRKALGIDEPRKRTRRWKP